MTRLKTLQNRYDRLLEANNVHHFTQSGNVRIDKYYACLLYIKRQIHTEQMRIINIGLKERNKVYSKVRQGFLNPQNGFTMSDLRLLTQP